jgi:LysR family transcriptional activator of glutamate synthase operon
MEVRQLRCFTVAARELHFTRAARELHIAQPALSQQIAQLERELGVRLFDRTRRSVRLTAAGESLRVRAEHILAEVERAEAEMDAFAGVVRGRVRIGLLASIGAFRLPDSVTRFHDRYPHVELLFHEDVTEQLAGLLAEAKLDLVIVHVTETSLPPGLAHPEVLTEPLLTEELVVIVPPDHAWNSRTGVSVAELGNEPFVAFKTGSGLRRILHRLTADAPITPRIVAESGDLGTIRGLVAAGLGLSIVPQSVAEAPGPPVTPLSLVPAASRTVLLGWRTDHQLSPAASSFLSFLRTDVAEHPWS